MIQANTQSSWDAPVVCRVEVDLSGWMQQLTGSEHWEVYDEDHNEECVSFVMRHGRNEAEVTLFHNGYAMVDMDGKTLFDGTLTTATSECAHLSYYLADSGEKVTLN